MLSLCHLHGQQGRLCKGVPHPEHFTRLQRDAFGSSSPSTNFLLFFFLFFSLLLLLPSSSSSSPSSSSPSSSSLPLPPPSSSSPFLPPSPPPALSVFGSTACLTVAPVPSNGREKWTAPPSTTSRSGSAPPSNGGCAPSAFSSSPHQPRNIEPLGLVVSRLLHESAPAVIEQLPCCRLMWRGSTG